MEATRPLVVHVVYSFDTGGLENGVVNLINQLPPERFRHAVVALTGNGAFRSRIRHADVPYVCLNKGRGHSIKLYPRLYRLFRKWRPAIVHTRNLAALEVAVPAWLAGVPVRIHGEHGWDHDDVAGVTRKKQLIRRIYSPFVTQYVALSNELFDYLTGKVAIRAARATRICNGVDTEKFSPVAVQSGAVADFPFRRSEHLIVGSVGRMHEVKGHEILVQAFIRLLQLEPALAERLRLVIVGDGPLKPRLERSLQAVGLADLAWLPGDRSDIDQILRTFDFFVLPSRAEGISNTILEAMATGLPVIATRVGGNSELVQNDVTGQLVPVDDPLAIAEVLRCWSQDALRSKRLGNAARRIAESELSLRSMVDAYCGLYCRLLKLPVPHETGA